MIGTVSPLSRSLMPDAVGAALLWFKSSQSTQLPSGEAGAGWSGGSVQPSVEGPLGYGWSPLSVSWALVCGPAGRTLPGPHRASPTGPCQRTGRSALEGKASCVSPAREL